MYTYLKSQVLWIGYGHGCTSKDLLEQHVQSPLILGAADLLELDMYSTKGKGKNGENP